MTFVSQIMAHAQSRPGALAFHGEDGALSYDSLVRQAGSVARVLGADPSVAPVAVMLPKGAAAVAAMLGILMAGRCYLPIDPKLPEARRADMLSDSGAELVYVAAPDPVLEGLVPPGLELRPLAADLHGPGLDQPLAPRGPDAALLYTSGSTNRPKGVRLGYGAVQCFLDWAIGYFGLTPEDRVASHAPFGFDISLLDLWATLAAGGSVHAVPEGQMGNGRYLIRFLEDRGITLWQSVPTPLAAIGAELAAGSPAPAALRHLCTTGESLPEQVRRDLAALGPAVWLHNIYGCTETNDTFVFSLPITEAAEDGVLPIGPALPYVAYRIVDETMTPVLPGEPGELLVRSGAAFEGYTDPELTRAAHVRLEGLDWYRSRDLVMEDPDRILHFLGRTDHTIKLRGVRIDLREIETALGRFPRTTDVLACVIACPRKGRQLVGVLGNMEAVSPLALKTHCAALLPRTAIPDRFVSRPGPLPRNANGKIDRRAVARILEDAFNPSFNPNGQEPANADA